MKRFKYDTSYSFVLFWWMQCINEDGQYEMSLLGTVCSDMFIFV